MENISPDTLLPHVSTFEEYEKIKSEIDIFEKAAREIIAYHFLVDKPLSLFEGTNIVFSYGSNYMIKLFPPFHYDQFNSELLVMKHLHQKLSVSTPAIEYHGIKNGWFYIIMSRVEGTLLEGLWEKLDHYNKSIIIRDLGNLVREVHSLPIKGLEIIDCHWQKFISQRLRECVAQHQATNLSRELSQQIPQYLESAEDRLPKLKNSVLLTGEYTPMNILVKQVSGVWRIAGLIDFGDCMLGLAQYDLLGPGAFLIQGDKILLREFLTAYGYSAAELTQTLSNQLMLLMLLHRYSNLTIQIRIDNWMNKISTIKGLENLVWGF